MSALDRRKRILLSLQDTGYLSAREIAADLGVSPATARRDIDALSAAGRLTRVRGGASTLFAAIVGDQRDRHSAPSRIVQRAAGWARAGMTIGIVGGVGIEPLAAALSTLEGSTFVTNSLSIVNTLATAQSRAGASTSTLLLPGVLGRNRAVTGHLCIAALQPLHLDLSFVAVGGFISAAGSFSDEMLEAEVIRAFSECSVQTVALADFARWDTRGPMTIGATTLHKIVTNVRPKDSDVALIQSSGSSIEIV